MFVFNVQVINWHISFLLLLLLLLLLLFLLLHILYLMFKYKTIKICISWFGKSAKRLSLKRSHWYLQNKIPFKMMESPFHNVLPQIEPSSWTPMSFSSHLSQLSICPVSCSKSSGSEKSSLLSSYPAHPQNKDSQVKPPEMFRKVNTIQTKVK